MTPDEFDSVLAFALVADPADPDSREALALALLALDAGTACRPVVDEIVALLRGGMVADIQERLPACLDRLTALVGGDGQATAAIVEPAAALPAPRPPVRTTGPGTILVGLEDSPGISPSPAADDDPIAMVLRDFLDRNGDTGDELATLVLAWDRGEPDAAHDLRRRLHTLKGDAGMLGLGALQDLAHRVEDLARPDTRPDIQLLLRSCSELAEGIALARGDRPEARPESRPAAGGARDPRTGPHPATFAGGDGKVAPRTPMSLRVDVERVDALADAVGELGVAFGMLGCVLGPAAGDRRVQNLMNRMGRLLRTAQDSAGRLRMVPIRPVFARAERTVAELSPVIGRPVVVEMAGADTELDKAISEALGDPLLHLVRNALDHGIEPMELRTALGKPATGRIRLVAARRDGRVVVEVHDDGHGIDRARVLARANRLGLPTPPADAPDSAVWELLFLPGFSTRDEITATSGRGVGLDVVRNAVSALRGRVEVASVPGRGSTFTIVLPPTLVSIDGLGVMAGGQTYLLPTASVRGCLRPAPGDLTQILTSGRVLAWQGRQLPWRPLTELLGLGQLTAARPLAVVVDDGGHQAAIAVDAVLGRSQAVLKPVPGLPELPGVVGAAIGTDGRVGLVLEPAGLLAGATSALSEHP